MPSLVLNLKLKGTAVDATAAKTEGAAVVLVAVDRKLHAEIGAKESVVDIAASHDATQKTGRKLKCNVATTAPVAAEGAAAGGGKPVGSRFGRYATFRSTLAQPVAEET